MSKLSSLLFLLFFSFLNATNVGLDTKEFGINNITKNHAYINIGNLNIGQSGIIVHKFEDENSVILSNAIVVSSDANSSKIKFVKYNELSSIELPKSSLKPNDDDIFSLNYAYNFSILLTPSYEISKQIKTVYDEHSFIHSDIFASYLSINSDELPTKENLQKFCTQHNVRSLFFYVDGNIYIVDAISFDVVKKIKLDFKIDADKFMYPFFTKLKSIVVKNKNFSDYNEYYKKLLGIKNDK